MAYLKTDQQRIKELLSETIVLLCKNGLHFEAEFSIEALIAITLDQKDVLLVSIKETVLADSVTEETKTDQQANVLQSVSSAMASNQWSCQAPVHTVNRKRRYPSSNPKERGVHQRMSIFANSSYAQVPDLRKQELYSNMEMRSTLNQEVSDAEEQTTGADDRRHFSFSDAGKTDKRLDKDHLKQSHRHSFAARCDDEAVEDKDIVLVKDEPSVAVSDVVQLASTGSTLNKLHISSHGSDKADVAEGIFLGAVQSHLSSYSSWTYQQNASGLDGLEESSLQRVLWHPALTPLLGSSAGDVTIDRPHPSLSPDDLSTATAILTIPGAFINLGCVKAIRQKLRKVPKEVLVIILESMSVMRDSPFFVGMLRCEGISRTFYKCPPATIKQEALDYYQLDYSIYTELYNGAVKVPNNIKDPLDWIAKTKMMSPFLEQQQH